MTLTTATITFHPGLIRGYCGWAESLGWDARALRTASRTAIRTGHHTAALDSGPPMHPVNIYRLPIGAAWVYYTIEPRGVVIRGYGWDIAGEPRDDFDGGGFFTEPFWHTT